MRKINESPEAKLHTVAFMCADASMSRQTVMRLAEESGSLIRIGRMLKIDSETFYSYLNKVYKAAGE